MAAKTYVVVRGDELYGVRHRITNARKLLKRAGSKAFIGRLALPDEEHEELVLKQARRDGTFTVRVVRVT